LLVAVSSQVKSPAPWDEFLIPQNDLPACGLPKSSVVKLAKMVSLHKSLVIKRIGSMPVSTLEEVMRLIRESL
jgi:hypothetical protein